MIRVKICGNTNLDDARIAVDAGASLLGFIFYPKSPRCISVGGAREVSRALRGRAALVGVFVNTGEDEVRATLRDAELDLAQLHGDEPVRAVAAFAGDNRGLSGFLPVQCGPGSSPPPGRTWPAPRPGRG